MYRDASSIVGDFNFHPFLASKQLSYIVRHLQTNMTNIFKSNAVPLRMTINGTVNGTKFVVTGEGVGDSRTGKLRGKWVCNERDGCPMSWAALQTTFGYGYR